MSQSTLNQYKKVVKTRCRCNTPHRKRMCPANKLVHDQQREPAKRLQRICQMQPEEYEVYTHATQEDNHPLAD